MKQNGHILPWIGSGGLYLIAVAAGALLVEVPDLKTQLADTGAVYILGPARELLSKGLYERADVYFHKGAEYVKEEAFESIYQKWLHEIHPIKHVHAEGAEIEEIMPWLRLATKSNPHNVEAYLVASYWLNGAAGQPETALQVINEAIEKNPDRYELFQEKGRLLLGLHRDDEAASALESALAFVARPEQDDPEQAALDLSFILTIQSFLYEALGQQEQAIRTTEVFLSIHPDQPVFTKRLEALRYGKMDPEHAKERIEELFVKNHECSREEHDHDNDH
ncbi:MAG: hypothetical protein JXR25_10580 [Pontiellaceae bacterium]|nr:hypothetical protein [Pontiellaceae bacterium]MBN2785265.1 hypothetical protein [Pontiellaceae bacterium]